MAMLLSLGKGLFLKHWPSLIYHISELVGASIWLLTTSWAIPLLQSEEGRLCTAVILVCIVESEGGLPFVSERMFNSSVNICCGFFIASAYHPEGVRLIHLHLHDRVEIKVIIDCYLLLAKIHRLKICSPSSVLWQRSEHFYRML